MSEPRQTLGVDVGGTRIKAAVVRADGHIVEQRKIATAENAEQLVAVVAELVAELAVDDAAVGVCAPGLAARDNRSIAWMRGRMEAVEGLPWSDALARDAWVLNDAHAAALGEAWIGAARGLPSAIVLTLGTGVGGGVVIDGRVLQGAIGRAGHLGHITLDALGAPDIVGMPGSLEDWIGNHNVRERTGGAFSSTLELLDAAAAGDAKATQVWQRSVHGLAVAIASLVNAFDPHAVVLGGGIAAAGAALFEPLQTYLDQCEWRPTGAATPVIAAQLGDMAGAVGAARFALLQRSALEVTAV
jgi:glucokinase